MKELVSVLMDISIELKRIREVKELELRFKAGLATISEVAEKLNVDVNRYHTYL